MSAKLDPKQIFSASIENHLQVISALHSYEHLLHSIAEMMARVIREGKKIMFCGNGGSAADSQHLAAEIVGRFRRNRRGLPSIALTTDTSILTAIGNDFGYDAIFSRQVEALGNSGDLLVGISTSGNSPNVVKALQQANTLGICTVAFTGAGGGLMGDIAQHLFAVPSSDTARIQEAHILAGHMLCDWVEADAMLWEPDARMQGVGAQ